jgi:DNA-binding response OmpR family regulator/class 3 adenylate cyclase/tetratricopeptide (TPR) repeat protein
MRSRIMVVGQDVAQRARLARLLSGNGYRVEIAESAAHARRVGFDGIELAIVAPDGLGPAGRGLVQDLRAAVGRVLLVAAPGDKSERHGHLRNVPDEAALLALVAEALAPTAEPEALEPVLQFAGYRLDLAGHSLLDTTGKEVPLTHGEFGLLRVFVRRAGRVLSRDQLLQLLSGRDAEAYDRCIDMQIVRLRRKIEPDPKRPTLIVTIPNNGYKFTATVRQVDAATSRDTKPAAAPPESPPVGGERRFVTAVAAEVLAAEGRSLPRDPEELRPLIDAWRRYAAAVVTGHEGALVESRRGEVLACFGYPVAQEHAAERALQAALALADHLPVEEMMLPAGLAIRVGVASGIVIADPDGEVLGETPGEAVRLQDLAEPGQVIVGASTRRLAGDLFAYRDLGPQIVRGVTGPVPAWQALGRTKLGSHSEALHGAAVTPLVGREEELHALLRAWQQAKSGEGGLVLVSGEPGIGKSRLLAALEERLADEPHAGLRYFCSPLHQESTLHPIVARWEQEAGFARGDSAEERLRKLEEAVASAKLSPEDFTLIAAMLSVPTGARYLQLELNPQRRKERTLAALLHRLERLTHSHPVLMLFEDAQWADPSSVELLEMLIDRLSELPILLVISFRAEFTAAWSGRAGVSLIALSRLNRRHSETLAARVSAERALTREVLERIVTQTDGVPLFIEELTKAVLETSTDPATAALPLAVPGTLHASLMARLDRLPTARQVAQIGAVIGREFSHALLAAAAALPQEQLARGLDELIASGLVARRGAPPDAVYTFNHALTRDVAYSSLLGNRRQACHQRIATALEVYDGRSVGAAEPELLAYHFQEAGDFSAALGYWIAAGDVAEQHGANQEAVAHYQSAKKLTERADLSAADRDRVPEVLMKLGNAQTQMTGYHSEGVMRSYLEARDVALAFNQQDEAAEAAMRIAPFLFGSCRHHDVMEIGNKILSGNPDRLRPQTRVHLWTMMGGASSHIGDFQQSLTFSEKAIELDDEVACTHKSPWAAADPAIVARDYVEMAARMMGHFERSLSVSEQSMAIALGRGHLFSVVWATVSRVSALCMFGRYAEAVAFADRAIEVCEKYGFDARIGNVLLHRGPALFDLGYQERGLADIQRGVDLWRKTSGTFMLARNVAILAEYQLRANLIEEACISLSEAERLAETTEEKDQLAEIIRLRGRIWQSEGHRNKARPCFERALARSRDQRARLFELHAARDLARLSAEAGGSTEALKELRSIVDWFPVDLDVPVLAECRAVLQQAASV